VFNKPAVILFACATLVSAGGAQCLRPTTNAAPIYGPRVLTENPSTGDVIQVVNANSALIRSLYSTDATMSVPGAPSLRANLALERQRKLRLRAETALTGAEVDMGSNDELFWFWVRRNPPPTLYYCRHDRFATSAAKEVVPVDPEWLLDALGLVTFDAYHQHSTPTKNRNGKWEVRTSLPSANGLPPMSKVTVVDDARGFVLEQHLYDAQGGLVASSLTSRHWRDPTSGAIVPQTIEINWPATQFTLKFEVRTWTVNNLQADPAKLFAMPSHPGWAMVDLGERTLRAPGTPVSYPASNPMSSNPASPTPYSSSGGFGATRSPTPDAISAAGPSGSTFTSVPAAATPYPYAAAANGAPPAGRDLLGWTGPQTMPSVSPFGAAPGSTFSASPTGPSLSESPFSTAAGASGSSIRSARAVSPPAAPGMLR